MSRHLDHIDLRVPSLAEAAHFYEALLPALGFTRRADVDGWLQFESETDTEGAGDFFGVTESPAHQPNENRIAFRTDTPQDVDRIAAVAESAGAGNLEGPMDYDTGYYAAFFEDPCGNRFEICHRSPS